ncbi:MAG: hypothetical protein ACKVZJ_10565 [Phycisphaerales bacterium]
MTNRAPSQHPGANRVPGVGGGRIAAAWILLLGVGLFGGLAWFMSAQQSRALRASAVDDRLTAQGAVRPEAAIARAVRSARLVTVIFETNVTAQSLSPSWRGDVTATAKAPVRLMFGVDLSNFAEAAVKTDPFGSAFVVTLPRPTRIATEVLGEGESIGVAVGWLRLRSMSGEYHLGLARRGLYDAARTMMLRPADARLVEDATREQVTGLIHAIAGERATVEVRFAEAAAPAPSGGAVPGGVVPGGAAPVSEVRP